MIPFDLFAWVQDVRAEQLPASSFPLTAGVTVLDPAKWLKKLQADCLMPKRPRAVFGALQQDLRRLHELCNGM